MQITRLRYTLPPPPSGRPAQIPVVMPAESARRGRRPPFVRYVVSVTAQHLEISEWVNYGPTERQRCGRDEREGGDCANCGRLLAGHGVTVGILVTRPNRLPRLRAPARSHRRRRLLASLVAKRWLLNHALPHSKQFTSRLRSICLAVTRGARAKRDT